MFQIAWWLAINLILLTIFTLAPMSRGECIFFGGVWTFVMGIWASVLIEDLLSYIKAQAEAFYSLAMYDTNKKSYQAALDSYKGEMQTALVEKYREFETALAKSVTDSKLVAAVLKKSSYGEVLQRYENRIEGLIEKINSCDRDKADAIQKMLSRQANFGKWALFIPSNLRYIP